MNEYTAVRGVQNDKTGQRFEPGDPVPANAFTQAVLDGWVARGILLPPKEDKKPGKAKARNTEGSDG
jgi:hypothetical protein